MSYHYQAQWANFLGFLKKDCEGFPIMQGSSGAKVIEVQQFMRSQGQNITPDGQFGAMSVQAAKAVFGTDVVTCDAYRKRAGKGITEAKVNTAVEVTTGIAGLISAFKDGGKSQPAPLPPPPPPPPDNTPIYIAGGIGLLVVIILIVLLVVKK